LEVVGENIMGSLDVATLGEETKDLVVKERFLVKARFPNRKAPDIEES